MTKARKFMGKENNRRKPLKNRIIIMMKGKLKENEGNAEKMIKEKREK